MNKQQLIKAISLRTETTAVETKKIVDAFIDITTEKLVKGDDIKIVGFGTFHKQKRKARMGYIPSKNLLIKVPAIWTIKFNMHKKFKEAVK